MQGIFKNIKIQRQFLLLIFDITGILFSSLISHFIILTIENYDLKSWTTGIEFVQFTWLMILIYPIILYIYELYKITKNLRRIYVFANILIAGFVSCCLFLLFSRIFGILIYGKLILFLFFLISNVTIFGNRIIFSKYIVTSESGKSNLLLVGSDVLTETIINETKNSDYNIVGLLSQENSEIGQYRTGLKIISTGKNLGNLIKSKKIKTLVLASSNHVSLAVIKKMYKYKFKGVQFLNSIYFYEILTRKFAIEPYLKDNIAPFPDLNAFTNPVFKNTKKLIDFSGALISFILLMPLLLLISLLIKITSRGPVFYLQDRVGFQENIFKLIKFRTMIVDAEKESGPKWASRNDLRITKFGKYLRKTRLDELPQLINILKSEMSFVGPRAFRKHFVEKLEKKVPFYSLKFSIKPGLTGWAQVNHYYKNDIQTLQDNIERLQYDLYYIKHASLFLDLFIILKTLQTVVRRPGY